jgi:hypothetical protein
VSGIWYIDNWITPFLELGFEQPREGYRALRLKIYRPPVSQDAKSAQSVLIRAGAAAIGEVAFPDGAGQFVTTTLRLPDSRGAARLDISLRTSRILRPPLPDRRNLGLVLLHCYPVRRV